MIVLYVITLRFVLPLTPSARLVFKLNDANRVRALRLQQELYRIRGECKLSVIVDRSWVKIGHPGVKLHEEVTRNLMV